MQPDVSTGCFAYTTAKQSKRTTNVDHHIQKAWKQSQSCCCKETSKCHGPSLSSPHRWLWNSICTEKPSSSPWPVSVWRRKASLLCQHCPCLEGKLLQTLFFRTLNDFPVTPSQKLLITHPASSEGLCLSAFVHTLSRELWQDRNWFINGSSIRYCRAGDEPRKAGYRARQHRVWNRALESTAVASVQPFPPSSHPPPIRGLEQFFLELSCAD